MIKPAGLVTSEFSNQRIGERSNEVTPIKIDDASPAKSSLFDSSDDEDASIKFIREQEVKIPDI